MIEPMNPEQWNQWRQFVVRRWGVGVKPSEIAAKMARKFNRPFSASAVREIARILGLPEQINRLREFDAVYPAVDPWPAEHHFRGRDVPDRDNAILRFRATERHAERPAGAAA